jgi:hypothetical protein
MPDLWQPIASAPKDGSRVLCWAKEWGGAIFLVWKTNYRIVRAKQFGEKGAEDLATEYFGDPLESDDYDFARPAGAPTHWYPLVLPEHK